MEAAKKIMGRPLIIVAAMLALPVHAQIYKCTEDGKTVFSDKPCRPDAKPIEVRPAAGQADPEAEAAARRAHQERLEKLRERGELRARQDAREQREREARNRLCDSIQADIDRYAAKIKHGGGWYWDVAGHEAAVKRYERECK